MRTDIDPVFQFQAFMNISAGMASLGTGIEPIRDPHFDADDFCFALQFRQEGIEPFCRDCFCEMSVLHHALDVQVFHGDEAWLLLHDFVDGLVFMVFADMIKPLIKFLHLEFLLIYVCRAGR